MSPLKVAPYRNGVASLALFGVLVVGWIWQFAAYMALYPKGVRWISVKDPRTVWIAWIPWWGVAVGLAAVALSFSALRRGGWGWNRHLLCWVTAIILFVLFTVTSIFVQLSLTGLTPAH